MRRFCRLSSLIILGAMASFASVGCVDADDIADMPDSPDTPNGEDDPGLDVADGDNASEASAPEETPPPQAPDAGSTDNPAGPARQQPGTSNTGDTQYFVDAGSNKQDGVDLWIESSYLDVERHGATTYVNWYAAVRNRGLTTVCETRVTASLENAADIPARVGSKLASLEGFVDSAAYQLDGLPASVACIAPGERGVFFALAETDRRFRNRDVSRIAIHIDATVVPDAVPNASAPTIVSPEFERADLSTDNVDNRRRRGRRFRLMGEVRNESDAELTELRYSVYGATNDGLFRAMVSIAADSLAAGDSWSVQTSPRPMRSSRRIASFPSFTLATTADPKDLSDTGAAILDRRSAHQSWASDREELGVARDRARQWPGLP